MLSLALKRKIPVTEDVLTAAALDALSDESAPVVLQQIITSVVRLDRSRLPVPAFDAYCIELWPQTDRGEPDARIRLLRGGGKLVGHLLVEAKLGAPKSGMPGVSGSQDDQLGRYLLCESEILSLPWFGLLYVTHHGCCPDKDLHDTEVWLTRQGRIDLCAKAAWVGWKDVARIFGEGGALCRRVVPVFRSVSMYRFSGLDSQPPARPPTGWIYTGRRAGAETVGRSWPPMPRVAIQPNFYQPENVSSAA